MLYHHLSAPRSGVDIEQMVVTLRERLDTEAFRHAWDKLVNRHAAFRSGFEWESSPHPIQVENARVVFPWEHKDLRTLPPEEHRQHIAEYLDQDRKLAFDLRVAPLARAALFQTGESEWEFVWSFHHILADGQTYPALIREAFSWYDAIRGGKELTLAEPPSYREYVQWLGAHLTEQRVRAEAYWREMLQGFTAPTPLPGATAGSDGQSGRAEASFRLSASVTSALNAFAQTHQLNNEQPSAGSVGPRTGSSQRRQTTLFLV